jgi:hypothetical protein
LDLFEKISASKNTFKDIVIEKRHLRIGLKINKLDDKRGAFYPHKEAIFFGLYEYFKFYFVSKGDKFIPQNDSV